MDQGRQADMAMLSGQWKTASPETRKKIEHTMHNIRNESPLQRSMRQELIKASRSGDTQKAREIREYVSEKKKYQNE